MELFSSSCSAVHRQVGCLKPYIKTITPYGSRLTWQLTNQNQLVVHLKDKRKIRHKKRWSQVIIYVYRYQTIS